MRNVSSYLSQASRILLVPDRILPGHPRAFFLVLVARMVLTLGVACAIGVAGAFLVATNHDPSLAPAAYVGCSVLSGLAFLVLLDLVWDAGLRRDARARVKVATPGRRVVAGVCPDCAWNRAARRWSAPH